MNYKIEGALKKNRINLILFLILWIFLAIVLIAFTYGYIEATTNGGFELNVFIDKITLSPFKALIQIIENGQILKYFKALGGFTLIYATCIVIGLIRSAPKHKYSDIEHGSSDWSEKGEQYSILSNKTGIILGEKNYLPVDKRGNVNVLVVGRIRIW